MQSGPIALLSDTHDAKKNLAWALETLRARGVEQLLFCGDLNSPRMIESFDGFDPIFVLGNADRQEEALREAVERRFGSGRVGMVHTVELEGRRIAITHGHTKELRTLVESQEYDYVIHGHTHRRKDENEGKTRILNPGALGGIKRESRSFALLYPETGKVEFVEMGA